MASQIYLGSLALNTYTLCVAAAALLGCASVLWQARSSWDAFTRMLNALLLIAFCALAAGRIGYVLLNFAYFREHLQEIISASSPGYWEHAAIAGGVVGWLIARRWAALSSNALVPAAALIGIGASFGCIPHGCAYGREVFWTDGWVWNLRADLPDAYLINNPRLPTQLFMAGWLAITLAFSLAAARRRAGLSACVWLLGFALGDCAIQFQRADASPVWGGLRAAQWADIFLSICSTLVLLFARFRHSSPDIKR